MGNRDWFDDFMDYKLSGWENKERKAADSSGCLSGIVGVLLVLGVIAVLFG